jgi:hypothetical protein
MKRSVSLLLFLLLTSIGTTQAGKNILSGISIGPWLLHENGTYANWLGIKVFGKKIKEPINVVIIDQYSKSEEQAISKIIKQTKIAGYEEEYGHSAGYCSDINGIRYKQIPNNRRMAFSNKDFFQTNNHGRIIGPANINGTFVFVGAFSTERPSIFKGFKHLFVSFNKARDDFCAKMDKFSIYTNEGILSIGNIANDSDTTTADHDGNAIVLIAKE